MAQPAFAVHAGRVVGRERTLFAALSAAALGLVILFGVGFAQPMAIHQAAHDARHSAAFPCH